MDSSVTNLLDTLEFEFADISIAMLHNSGSRAGRRKRLRRRFPHARVVLFGHSHEPGIDYEDGLLLINPGGASKSCALLHVENGNAHGEIVDLENGKHHSAGHYLPLSIEPPKRPKGADFTTDIKKLLLEKANHKCQSCFSRESLEFSHSVPVSEGGRGTLDNGRVLCRRCRFEKTRKDRRRKELNKYLNKEPTRTISNHDIDLKFDHLLTLGALLPVEREELYGLTVKSLVNKLRAKEADHLALDLVRPYVSDDHAACYRIGRKSR